MVFFLSCRATCRGHGQSHQSPCPSCQSSYLRSRRMSHVPCLCPCRLILSCPCPCPCRSHEPSPLWPVWHGSHGEWQRLHEVLGQVLRASIPGCHSRQGARWGPHSTTNPPSPSMRGRLRRLRIGRHLLVPELRVLAACPRPSSGRSSGEERKPSSAGRGVPPPASPSSSCIRLLSSGGCSPFSQTSSQSARRRSTP